MWYIPSVMELKELIVGNPAALSVCMQVRHGVKGETVFLEDSVCADIEEARKTLSEYRAKNGVESAAVRYHGDDVYFLVLANAGEKVLERKVPFLDSKDFFPRFHWYSDCVQEVEFMVEYEGGKLTEPTKELLKYKPALGSYGEAREYLMEQRKNYPADRDIALCVKYRELSWLIQYGD